MLHLALAFLLLVLITEYGFQTRKAAMRGFAQGWHWRRSVLRLAGWLSLCLAGEAWRNSAQLVVLALGATSEEVTAYVLHRTIGAQVERGLAHGSPTAHVIPLLASAVYGLLILGLQALFSMGPFVVQKELAAAIAISVTFTALWSWSTLTTVSLVDLVRPGQVRDDLTPSLGGGEMIGVLERLVAFGLVLSGALAALGFIVAAKSAARFPQFKQEAFAEYFLIGTLSSVGLAVLSAILLGYLIHLI